MSDDKTKGKTERERSRRKKAAEPRPEMIMFSPWGKPTREQQLRRMVEQLEQENKSYRVMYENKLDSSVREARAFDSPWEALMFIELNRESIDPRFIRVFVVGPSQVEP